MNQKTTLLYIFAVVVIAIIAYFILVKSSAPPPPATQVVFVSQEECELQTGNSCDFQMCDYIPLGKTFEEVCGKDFKKGWVPVSDSKIAEFDCGLRPQLYKFLGISLEESTRYDPSIEELEAFEMLAMEWRSCTDEKCGPEPPVLCPASSELSCISSKWSCYSVNTDPT